MISALIVLIACAAGAITDLRTRRIPNVIPISLAVAGAIVAAVSGWQTLLVFAAIGVAVIAGGTVLFSFKLLGGGDVKLLAAACASLAASHLVLPFLLATILSGGVIGIAIAAMSGRLRATAEHLQAMALPVFAGGSFTPVAHGTKMPYGLAIFCGAVVALTLQLATR